ncbi:MAG: hypothetical protein B6I31_02415 [Desulfobacteraceae bacterium 4572_19]|nr:MAG: hypothetical protein B6I31_02415 [Desulfobacteraceae bacterium 4572_19]
MRNLEVLSLNPMVKIYQELFENKLRFNFQINTSYSEIITEMLDAGETIKISEEVYWERYYEDTSYEWNNGILEEKPVSDYQGIVTADWFNQLLRDYNKAYPTCKVISLEMGFTLNLPDKKTIRKPDIGIILNSNLVELELFDISYSGVVDFCIEILSDSNIANVKRDTVTKKEEYCLAGVKEYLIIDGKGERTAFYRLSNSGNYEPVKPVNNVFKSEVLPHFQFRESDLYSRPSQEEMSEDEVYKDFVFLSYQSEKQRADVAEQRADVADQRADAEKQKADIEKQKTKEAEAKIKKLAAKLKSLGINV